MSTFGKKSLIWWDYNDHSVTSALRFNSTHEETQIKILERWYPINTKFIKYHDYSGRYGNKDYQNFTEYFIRGYTKSNFGWTIDYAPISGEFRFREFQNINIHKTPLNPVKLIVNPEDIKRLKRIYKLDKIL